MDNDKIQILLVEDDAMNYVDIQAILEAESYEVLKHPGKPIIDNYDDAIAACSSRIPHIAILDIIISGERSGIDVGRYLREKFGTPVIFLSGHNTDENLDQSGLLGADGFVVKRGKPLDLDQLLADVRRLRKKALLIREDLDVNPSFYIKEVDKTTGKDTGYGFRKITIDLHELKIITTTPHFRNSVEFRLKDGRRYVYHKLLTETLAQLPRHFVRISGSTIVNTKMITARGKSDWAFNIGTDEYLVAPSYRTDTALAILKGLL